jgi:hypothetical protein
VARPVVAPRLKTDTPQRHGAPIFGGWGIDMATYSEKLKHPLWQKKRLEILQRDDFRCQICFDNETTLHVHHKRYTKGAQPWEYDDCDLATVCQNCHPEAHALMERIGSFMASLPINDGPFGADSAISLVHGFYASMPKGYPGIRQPAEAQFDPYLHAVGGVANEIARCNIYDIFSLAWLCQAYGGTRVIQAAFMALRDEDAIGPGVGLAKSHFPEDF